MPDVNAVPPGIGLDIDANKLYRAGALGSIDVRVTAGQDAPIPQLALELSCVCLDGGKTRKVIREIQQGKSKEIKVQWRPPTDGEAVIKISATLHDAGGRSWVFGGETSVLIVAPDERAPATSFHIDIHDIEKMMGVDMSGLVKIGRIGTEAPDPEALLARFRSRGPHWIPVPLEYDAERTARLRAGTRLIVGPPQEQVAPTTAAVLEWRARDEERRVEIVSMQPVRCGRDSQKNDIVLVYLPRSDDNDARSRGISRQQFVLECAGETLHAASLSSAGTYLNRNTRLEENKRITLPDACVLTAGMLGLDLSVRVVRVPDERAADRTLEFLAEQDRAGGTAPGPGAVAAVSIQRLNNAPELAYCWLLSSAEIGRHADCALVFTDPSVAPRHARLLHWRGRYYLEALSAETGTWVDDRRLEAGEVFTLGPAHALRFGTREARWRLGSGPHP